MQVKKFEAKSMQEALQKIKLEMGPEAIILQAKKKKGALGVGNTGVEVTAAIPQTALIKKQYAEARMPKDVAEKLKNSPAKIQKETYDRYGDVLQKRGYLQEQSSDNSQKRRKAIIKTRYVDIKEEDQIMEDGTVAKYNDALIQASDTKEAVRIDLGGSKVKTTIDRKSRPDLDDSKIAEKIRYGNIREKEENAIYSDDKPKLNMQRYTARMMVIERLVFEGVDRYYVDQIMSVMDELTRGNIDDIDKDNLDRILIKIMSSQIKVEHNITNTLEGGPNVLAFVGPTGSGKTTTLAKIAAKLAIEQRLKVGLICFGTNSTEPEQLQFYANLMNLPIKTIRTNIELLSAIRNFSSLDVILIDTPGVNQQDGEKIKWLSSMLSINYPLITNLVISASTKDQEQKEIVDYYQNLSYNSIIFTKLDEVSMYGNLFNTCIRSKKPLSYTTMGQKVPEDIVVPSADEIAELIVNRP